jgi:hypothetical protein
MKKLVIIFCILGYPCWAGMRVMAPGKGSHAGGAALATFSDDFNRANETPLSGGGNWVTGAGPTNTVNLDTNTAQGTTLDCLASVVTPAFANNQKSTIAFISGAASDISPAVRIQSSTNPACYLAFFSSPTTCQIYKNDSSFGSTAIGAGYTVTSMTAGDTASLSATGTTTVTLELFRNGVSQGTRTDSSSTLTGGQPGFHISGTNRLDTFSATDL